MGELKDDNGKLERKLDPENAKNQKAPKVEYFNNETAFRWDMNEDAMATEKLAEGIRNFAKDGCRLDQLLKEKL